MKMTSGKAVVAILVCLFTFAGFSGPVLAGEKIISIPAKPEPVKIDVARTAVIIVDMQNAFATKGGMFDLVGQDISAAKGVIETIKKTTQAARAAGAKVIYLTYEYAADMSDSGGPDSRTGIRNSALWQ